VVRNVAVGSLLKTLAGKIESKPSCSLSKAGVYARCDLLWNGFSAKMLKNTKEASGSF
jgi:hypothetical protein